MQNTNNCICHTRLSKQDLAKADVNSIGVSNHYIILCKIMQKEPTRSIVMKLEA